MSALQKQACFNLTVVVVTLLVVAALTPWGKGALGGFGLLGLLGLSVLFFRRKPGQVLADERDAVIVRRSWFVAYTVFWMAFIAVGTLASLRYPESVPTILVQAGLWGAISLVFLVQSVTALVLYARG
jgi:hypothetical protein